MSGYQVQYATNNSFTSNKKTVTVKGKSNDSTKVQGLKSKKTYFVRVRTYKTANGKKYYSSWSAAKKVTTK
ncbi:MAG: fibronectin type III domain-containing protein [Clostridiales bacterium]|nr:fibronectin type III domain-containing protein [Clostridiales bacterium]